MVKAITGLPKLHLINQDYIFYIILSRLFLTHSSIKKKVVSHLLDNVKKSWQTSQLLNMYHGFKEEMEGCGAMGENRREKREKKKKVKVQQARTANPDSLSQSCFSVLSKKLCGCSWNFQGHAYTPLFQLAPLSSRIIEAWTQVPVNYTKAHN